MNIVNCTPHSINIHFEDGDVLSIEPSGIVPRCSVKSEMSGSINGIPVFSEVFGDVENIPEERENTILIVSRIVVAALPSRTDLVFPTQIVRNDKGQIVGCRGFGRA